MKYSNTISIFSNRIIYSLFTPKRSSNIKLFIQYTIMELEEILEKEIGLSIREAKTYLALLKLGQTTTGPLSKESSVASSKLYSVLSSLEERGLASHVIKGKTKYFQGEDPKKIISLFKEKERTIKEAVRELEIKNAQLKDKSSVEMFEGIKAVKNLLIDLSENSGKELWRGFGNVDNISSEKMGDFYEWWGARKYFIGIKDHLLISEKHKEKFEKTLSSEAKETIQQIARYSKTPFPGDVAIFRENIVIFNYDNIPTAILITSKSLAQQYKDFFLSVWKQAKN